MNRNLNEVKNSDKFPSEIEIDNLNLEDLDVEELENRLELAAGSLQAAPCIVVAVWEF